MKRGCYTKIPGSDVAVIFDGRAEGIIDGSSESEGRAEGINDGDGSIGDVEGLSVFDRSGPRSSLVICLMAMSRRSKLP